MKTVQIRVFLIVFLLSSSLLNAQNSSWIWAESFGGSTSDFIRIIDSDDQGNIYFAGGFASNTLELGEFILQNIGLRDGFVGKCNETGEVIWATNIGGTNNEVIEGLCTDEEGNTYIAGHFESYYITIGGITIPNNGSWDCFIAKFDPVGNVIWARGFGGPGEDILYAIDVDSYGNIWVSGHFDNPSLSLDDITLFNPYPGKDEVMLVKANADGDIIFGTTAKGDNDDRCYRLAIDKDDNVIISGGFGSSSISFSSHILSNYGSYDVFLTKYDNNGNVIWAKGAQGPDADYGYSISTDSEGNIYTTGYFLSPYIYFDEYYINNNGDFDAYIVKYSAGGDVMWVDGIGGIYEDRGYGLCILNDNKLFVTGTFKSPSLQVGTQTLLNNGDYDCFFIELDLDGNVISAENIGGANKEGGQALTTSIGDRVILGGYFTSSSINIGDHTLINSNQGYSDSFIAEFGVIDLFPIADFDYEASNLTVNFNNTSQYATSFLWDFGDGIGSDLEDPVHTYNEFGDYVVTLIAFNGEGSDTISKTIHLCELPLSSFEFEIEGYQISFLNLSLNALSYFWYFDDGNFAYLENPVYTYSEEGEYNVYLVATNDCRSDTSFAAVQICIAPTAGFGFIQHGFEISFINNSIKFDSCSWDFGDGFGSTNTNPAHTYSNEGEYNVFLTVYNTCGEDSYNTEISIYLSPVADFDYEINEFDVHFQNLSLNAESFLWDFGDGTISEENDPVHSYEDIGQYTVTLIAFNEYGDDTLLQVLDVTDIPEFPNQHPITIYPNPAHEFFTLQTVAPGVNNID
ncbi:MAG: PKD domain-containing protein, partial [Bacteroidales bacterium]|nr:PKD domain-containing protein [Bacteroidales bacterium]